MRRLLDGVQRASAAASSPRNDFVTQVLAGARRPAVVAPCTYVVAVHAAAECLDIVEEELVRSSYFGSVQHASEDHKTALVEVRARRGAVGDVELVDVDEARRF